MTEPRPEHGTGPGDPYGEYGRHEQSSYGQGSYGQGTPSHEQGAYGRGPYEGADAPGAERPADPLNDPLPDGQPPPPEPGRRQGGRHRGRQREGQQDGPGPAFPGPPRDHAAGQPGPVQPGPVQPGPGRRRRHGAPWSPEGELPAGPGAAGPGPVPAPGPLRPPGRASAPPAGPAGPAGPGAREFPVQGPPGPHSPAPEPPAPDQAATAVLPVIGASDDETVGLRTRDTRRAAAPGTGEAGEPRTGGRAERRRAAKGGGRGRRRAASAATGTAAVPAGAGARSEAAAPSRPLSRVEARRAARALKESPAVIVSRVVGELFITFGVVMLLFVTYQLWWTNVRAGAYAGDQTNQIQDGWAKGRKPDAFRPGQGFAIMYIPKLDVVVPIAEGISKTQVLDRGMVGHYAEGGLKTAMPSARQGNFAVAGHRNTHGEPFRYINQLQPGDDIVVETQDTYYTYEMASILPQTPPSNVSVLRPVPPGSGFTGPGRYITLTTCTPEFTSTYRLIVWGKMVEERPRSKGKPDALVS
ncbi:class E sortase [Streptomyces sp. NPDC004749]